MYTVYRQRYHDIGETLVILYLGDALRIYLARHFQFSNIISAMSSIDNFTLTHTITIIVRNSNQCLYRDASIQ